jgi:hypothetical protein
MLIGLSRDLPQPSNPKYLRIIGALSGYGFQREWRAMLNQDARQLADLDLPGNDYSLG